MEACIETGEGMSVVFFAGGLLGSVNDPDVQQVFSNPKVGKWIDLG